MNGPVPIGCWARFGSLSMIGSNTVPTWPVRYTGNGTHGVLQSTSTVSGPVASIDFTSLKAGPVNDDWWMAVRSWATSDPVSGSPLLKVTFGRSVIVHVL